MIPSQPFIIILLNYKLFRLPYNSAVLKFYIVFQS
nr:MAG TPA: hypothetical protein [Caudoviricetes sp.]